MTDTTERARELRRWIERERVMMNDARTTKDEQAYDDARENFNRYLDELVALASPPPAVAGASAPDIEKALPKGETWHNMLSRALAGHSWVDDDPENIKLGVSFCAALLKEYREALSQSPSSPELPTRTQLGEIIEEVFRECEEGADRWKLWGEEHSWHYEAAKRILKLFAARSSKGEAT